MSGLDRMIAGITCREVLADLSSFVDGELPEARVEQLRAHVSSCRECEQLGGAIGELVRVLRTLREAPPLDDAIAARLRARLRAQMKRT